MPAVSEVDARTPVALLFGDAESCAHLRDTLIELGAELVYAETVESLESARLSASGAEVVVVSLDDVVDERFEEIDGLLEQGSWRVVYDDPETSAVLSGWEHARWLRHLRAKLHDRADVDPPRPESARPIEVDQQRAAGLAGSNVSVLPLRAEADAISTEDRQAADLAMPAEDSPAGAEPAWMAEALGLLKSAEDEPPVDDGSTNEEPAGDQSTPPQVVEDTLQDSPDSPLGPAAECETEEASSPVIAHQAEPESVVEDHPGDEADALPLDIELAEETETAAEASLPTELAEELVAIDANEGDEELPAFEIDAINDPLPDAETGDSVDSGEADYLSLHLDAQGDIREGVGQEPSVSGEDWLAQFHGEPTHTDVDLTIGDIEPEATAADSAIAVADADDAPMQAANLATDATSTAPESAQPEAEQAADADELTAVTVDSSQWSLVDYAELDDISEQQEDATTQAVEEVERENPDDFGFELVDPSEYLAPEAPVDRGEELFSAPELMSMQEALAPAAVDTQSEAVAQVGGGAPAAGVATRTRKQALPRLVVLGASIGGPDAVREFLAALPSRFPAAFVLAQHLGAEFVDLMIGQLAKSSSLPIRQPANAETAVVGEVLVVPKGGQLRLARDGEVQLHALPEDAAHDPSINLTLSMAAEAFGKDTVAIVFSGMGNDAVSGALDVAAAGGEVWAQDPDQCVVSAMVEAVAEAGVIKFTGSPTALAQRLIEKFGRESAT